MKQVEYNEFNLLDFIAGLIVGEGSFYWTKNKTTGEKTPAFSLRMHVRDKELVEMVRYTLTYKEKVYEYQHAGRHYVMLIVRNPGDLKNKVIPLIYPRLLGYKKQQFVEWFKQFSDIDVPENYRFIFNVFKRKFPQLYTSEGLQIEK